MILFFVGYAFAFKRSDTFGISGDKFCSSFGAVDSVNMPVDYKSITCRFKPDSFGVNLMNNTNTTNLNSSQELAFSACQKWAMAVSFLYSDKTTLFDPISCELESSNLEIRLNDAQNAPKDDKVVTCGIPLNITSIVFPKTSGPCGPNYNSASDIVPYFNMFAAGLIALF